MTNNDELKPCPFCGYKLPLVEGLCKAEDGINPETGVREHPSGICCAGCGCYCVGGDTDEEAITAWNTRASQNDGGEADTDILEAIEILDMNRQNMGRDEELHMASLLIIDFVEQALQRPSVDPIIIRALKSYRDEHCFDDSEYGIAIDKFLKQRLITGNQDEIETTID